MKKEFFALLSICILLMSSCNNQSNASKNVEDNNFETEEVKEETSVNISDTSQNENSIDVSGVNFVGEYKRDYDESTLTISDNGDETFNVNFSITRLCYLENGIGRIEDNKLSFEIEDPNENKMIGVIYMADDKSLVLEILDSMWELLPSGELFDGFTK